MYKRQPYSCRLQSSSESYVSLRNFPSSEISVQETFIGYGIKPENQIVREIRLHNNNNKYGCPQEPLCASLLNQMNQLLELLVMVEHEGEFIR